jgi:fructokinase
VHDVLVIGEALVDIVSAPGQAPIEHPGGSPANVALGLSRLGHSTRLLTRIGDDDRGTVIRKHLEASGVRLDPGSITASPTSTAIAHLNEQRVATYEFDLDWQLPADADIGAAAAVHTGSIAATLSPGGEDVARLVESAAGRCLVSYDPNARPSLMGTPQQALAQVERIIRACDVVKVSDEDLAWLTPGIDPIEVAQSWLGIGPALVVVTRGSMGAFAVLGSGVIAVPTLAIDVADTVGAGDALMAGLLDALARADLLTAQAVPRLRAARLGEIEPILNHAVAVAALTCTRPGADPPNQQELSAWLAARA